MTEKTENCRRDHHRKPQSRLVNAKNDLVKTNGCKTAGPHLVDYGGFRSEQACAPMRALTDR